MTTQTHKHIHIGIIGSPDFGRRITSHITSLQRNVRSSLASLSDAWNMILTERPNAILLEIGISHSDKQQVWIRRLLTQVRERLGNEVYVMVALLSCEKLAFAGDLLFENQDNLTPSGFIDSFLAVPPVNVASVPSLVDQLDNICLLLDAELTRRAEGKVALPHLGANGWVQSLADPMSRELWMRWLPRYAVYNNENPIIIGDTGTGKTNLAYAIHLLSGRKGKFISITPRDFSSSELVQAELFGAVAGAYTGAIDKWGLVKSAEGGTLFIDELQSIDKELQGKLITFIENKAYRRVGSAESIDADVRFVFASNRALYDMMETDVLRHDFAYRLERVQLQLLPLNERPLDVTAALGYALAKVKRQRPYTTPVYGFNSTAYRLLFSHRWPGNLRQLENCVAQLCEIADMNNANLIDEQAVAKAFQSKLSGPAVTTNEIISIAAAKLSKQALHRSIDSIETGAQQFIDLTRACALDTCGGDIDLACKMIQDNSKLLSLFAESLVTRELSK